MKDGSSPEKNIAYEIANTGRGAAFIRHWGTGMRKTQLSKVEICHCQSSFCSGR